MSEPPRSGTSAATTVIHIRDWQRSNPEHIYIGRAGCGQAGTFCNPIRVGLECPRCCQRHPDADSTLPCYEAYLRDRLLRDPVFALQVAELRGHTLVCHCKPGPCHGDVLARLADRGSD